MHTYAINSLYPNVVQQQVHTTQSLYLYMYMYMYMYILEEPANRVMCSV